MLNLQCILDVWPILVVTLVKTIEVASSTFRMLDKFVFIHYANQHITSNETIKNEHIWFYFVISEHVALFIVCNS